MQYDEGSQVSSFPVCPFTVKIVDSNLNIYSKPSKKGKITGQTGKGVFTIVDVKNKWGKLKSGAGWILLTNSSCEIERKKNKTLDQIAREIIEGKWGNGNERKLRLENAGYNYSEIQARVNKLLS